jgi:Fe-S-cluster containining protein
VPLSGYDIWLIARRQRLDPLSFVLALPRRENDPAGFRLDSSDSRLMLALDKRGRLRASADCVFLVELAGGHRRCGIYHERPAVCRAYPMELIDERLQLRRDVLCPPAGWTAAQLADDHWRVALQRQRRHFDLYAEVVARWNAWLADAPAGLTLRLADYLTYLMNCYDRLERLGADQSPAQRAAVEASWGRLPLTGPGGTVTIRPGEWPWLDDLFACRHEIDRLLPGVPPQPLVSLGGLPLPPAEPIAATLPPPSPSPRPIASLASVTPEPPD